VHKTSDPTPADIARQVVERELGSPADQVTPMTGGVVNFVFKAEMPGTAVVVRMNRDSLSVYRKEQWAMAQAAAAGANVPTVHAVNSYLGHDYMLMSLAPGYHLAQHRGDVSAVVRRLGEQARLVNDIPVRGFGFHLDLSGDPPVGTGRHRAGLDFRQRRIARDGRIGRGGHRLGPCVPRSSARGLARAASMPWGSASWKCPCNTGRAAHLAGLDRLQRRLGSDF
jgi:hypothetical protein